LVLGLYPLVPATHHRLSKNKHVPNPEENQQLLEESLAAQRKENRRQVEVLLNDAKRLTETESGSRISFTRSEVECLLQVLNDVRVGTWLELGSPDEPMEIKQGMSPQTVRQLLVMDAAGFFEMHFLGAVSGSPRSRHD
ncbi:MAG TPA: hypothetical protein VFF11_15155, partial [Candidatus Binatia bacterium]|nr:hypothetical protein [Candidatus Binatia bacterium]